MAHRDNATNDSRRISHGGPANSPAFPLGILLLFLAAAFQVAGEGFATWAASTALAGLLAVGYALATSYKWVEQNFFHRKFALGLNNLVMLLGVMTILGFANVIAYRHNAPWDLTHDQKFSLSEQTLKILGALEQDVEILAFFIEGSPDDPEGQRAGQEREMMEKLLERYDTASERVSVKMIDPEKEPMLTKQYEVTYNGTTVMKSGDRSVKIDPDKIFEYNRNPFMQRLSAFNGEQAVTSALLDLTKGTVRTVYFLEGHGERSYADPGRRGYALFKEFLLRDQYRVESLNLMLTPEIPAAATVLVVAGPKSDYDPKEIEILDGWLAEGKSVLFLVDSDTPPNLAGLLKKYGVATERNLVLDPARTLPAIFGGSPVIPIPEFGQHAIAQPLEEGKRMVMMPWSTRLVKHAEGEKAAGLTHHELLRTSPESWAETDVDATSAQFDAGKDIKGPCVLAFAFGKEKPAPPPNPMEPAPPPPAEVENRVVVIGSAEMASSGYAQKGGNIDFVMNAINWLSGSTEQISIRPKKEDIPKLEVEIAAHTTRIQIVTMLLIPGFIFGLGGFIWWRRSSL